MRLYLLAFCFVTLEAQSTLTSEKAIETSLCEVVSSPADYAGRIVHVSGTVLWDRDTSALRAKDCKTFLRTGEYQWPQSVCIRGERIPTATSGTRSLALYKDTLYFYQVSLWKGEIEISASFVGRIEARSEYRAVPLVGGRFWTNGYCHMNLFPAILEVSKATGWTVKILQ